MKPEMCRRYFCFSVFCLSVTVIAFCAMRFAPEDSFIKLIAEQALFTVSIWGSLSIMLIALENRRDENRLEPS
ncbi:MAG: hypothetical protein QOG91_461 [Candidatus Parcubacteria bacterium]|nr:hypothetical protein [Candidatus Parcubacteria bacterium]